jgi:N-acetylated-alpha-linked acidic dipeptidase
MAKLLLLALSITRLTVACQRELRSLDLGLNPQNLPLVPRQETPFPPVWTENEKVLHESFSTATIDQWSSYYTHGKHIAGLNKSMAEETARQWTENGVPASLVEYEVFLNYPKKQRLVLKMGNGSHYAAQMFEDGLEEDKTTTYPLSANIPAFHGYSASAQVEAEFVYVGRGQKDDFAALTAANVSLGGKIALAKYGGPFRGVKVRNAEAHGMVGVVMFSDPGDDGPQVAKGQSPYPSESQCIIQTLGNYMLKLDRWASSSSFLHSTRISRLHRPIPRRPYNTWLRIQTRSRASQRSPKPPQDPVSAHILSRRLASPPGSERPR